MSSSPTKASVSENGQSAFAVTVDVSGHTLNGDEPLSKGGKNLGPAPYDLLLAALGECTAMTVRWFAKQKNWPLEHVSVILTHDKKDAELLPDTSNRSGTIDVFHKIVTIKGEQLSQSQKDALIKIAGRCPIQKTLEGQPIITTSPA